MRFIAGVAIVSLCLSVLTVQPALCAGLTEDETSGILAQVYAVDIRRIIDEATGIDGAIDAVKAVNGYVTLLRRLENEAQNNARLPADLESQITYMLEHQRGFAGNPDNMFKVLTGSCDLGAGLARAVISMAGGRADDLLDAVEAGQAAAAAAGELGTSVETVLQERLITDLDGRARLLTAEEAARLNGAPGATLQEKYAACAVYADGNECWLDADWRRRLADFARREGLSGLTPQELYDRYVAARLAEEEAAIAGADNAVPGLAQAAASDDPAAWRALMQAAVPDAVWNCAGVAAAREALLRAETALSRVGRPGEASMFAPREPCASWQLIPSAAVVAEYDRRKAARDAGAWGWLQQQGWREEITRRRSALVAAIDYCRGRHDHAR